MLASKPQPVLTHATDVFTTRCAPVGCAPEERFVETREDVLEDGYGCPNNRTDSYSSYFADLQERYGKAPAFKPAKDADPRTIYIMISYPFKNGPYVFKFVLADNVKMSYECILYANTIAMQRLEQEDTPSIHCIEELVYNGGSRIEVYANYVVCEFDCDS